MQSSSQNERLLCVGGVCRWFLTVAELIKDLMKSIHEKERSELERTLNNARTMCHGPGEETLLLNVRPHLLRAYAQYEK